jgi:hypothetical protein
MRPVVINKIGQYLTRSGETVTVDKIGEHRLDPSIPSGFTYGIYPNGVRETWWNTGHTHKSRETANDIVQMVGGITYEDRLARIEELKIDVDTYEQALKEKDLHPEDRDALNHELQLARNRLGEFIRGESL